MRVCIVTPFFIDNPDVSRPSYIRSVLQSNNSSVITVTSNYSHVKKTRIEYDEEDIVTVRTIEYKTNTSVKRFLSHLVLSFGLFFSAIRYRTKVDCFYVTAPFALTAMLIKLFTKKKVIVDIVDFWPNSLPFKENLLSSLFLSMWSSVNKFSCTIADRTISVSSNFIKLAERDLRDVILLSTSRKWDTREVVNRNELNVLYIGNVGRLYDFDSLVNAMFYFEHDVVLHIVGDGDMKDLLIDKLKCRNISFVFYGVIYDADILRDVVNRCDVGFNGYLNTNASFSYKAMSYFSYGLPVINSMESDLYEFVDEYGLGVNYSEGDYVSLLNALNTFFLQDKKQLFKNVVSFFETNLERSVVSDKIQLVFDEVCNEKTV